MKKVHHFKWLILSITIPLFVLACDSGPKEHAYFSSTPVIQPQIFASEIVSTELPEFATSFSPDGFTIYFNQTTPDRSVLKIMKSSFANGQWKIAEPLPFSDGTYLDVDPFISHDGNRLYFSSNRPLTGKDPKPDFDTWYVMRKDNGWSEPINPGPPLNSDANEIFVSVTANGTMYFSSDAGGESSIYRSEFVDGSYTEPEKIVLKIDGADEIGNPCIAPDESFIIFSAVTPQGFGGSDLYISRFRQNKWTNAINLGKFINSKFSDFAPNLSPDGNYLFFTSERPGIVGETEQGRPPGDIYQVELP